MAKSSSSSSASNSAEAKDAAGTGPSPYGTRSRNRNGKQRPNYAEDNNIDMMDFDTDAEKKDDGDPKKATRPANASSTPSDAAPPPRAAASSSSTRKPLPTMDNGKSSAITTIKDQHQQNGAGATAPVSSAANSGAAAQQAPSKKRKAGTQTASANAKDAQSSTVAQPSSQPSSIMKKPMAGATAGFAETNMMSFDDCKALPHDGTLTADDGTTLTKNGEQRDPSSIRPASSPGFRDGKILAVNACTCSRFTDAYV